MPGFHTRIDGWHSHARIWHSSASGSRRGILRLALGLSLRLRAVLGLHGGILGTALDGCFWRRGCRATRWQHQRGWVELDVTGVEQRGELLLNVVEPEVEGLHPLLGLDFLSAGTSTAATATLHGRHHGLGDPRSRIRELHRLLHSTGGIGHPTWHPWHSTRYGRGGTGLLRSCRHSWRAARLVMMLRVLLFAVGHFFLGVVRPQL